MTAKQQFVNTTQHSIGYNHFRPGTNEPFASVLFPGETCWLSEDEQIMTANAPRNADDNPFVTGALEPVTDERPIAGSHRPIAGIVGGAVQRPPAPRTEQRAETPQPPDVPDSIFEDTPEDRVAKQRLEAERQGRLGAIPASQVVEPEAAQLAGDMGGDDGSDPELDGDVPAEEASLGGEGDSVGEETAVDDREEVGAAVEPVGDAPEGEYAQHEEVGDPEAPSKEAGTPFRNGEGSVANGTPPRSKNKKRRNR